MQRSDISASMAVGTEAGAEGAVAGQEAGARLRTWPALLALYFLAPGAGEVMSGSTPPLLFVQPFGFIFAPLLYGSSAILIHEVIVRRRLGWANVLLLGAAFGVFQEALVVQTWFTYRVPASPSHADGLYGVLLGTNWYWALDLSIYHAIISITPPLILLGLLFPRRARLPWLGRKGTIGLLVWLLLPCGLLAYQIATRTFASAGYAGPPVAGVVGAVVILLALVVVGAFVRFPTRPMRTDDPRPAPAPWKVGLACFGLMLAFFFADVALPATKMPAIAAMAITAALLAFGLWRVRAWAARSGWGERHQLAIVMGVVAYFAFVWAPLVEFGVRLPARTGLTLFDLLVFAALALFGRRLRRRERGLTPAAPLAA